MGILGRISTGFELAVCSWKAIWNNKTLLLFPFISLMAQLCVIFVYVAGEDALGIIPALEQVNAPDATGEDKTIAFLILFAIYMVFNTITIFFNVGLIS